MIAGQKTKALAVSLLLSGIAIGVVKVVSDKKQKKQMLGQLSRKFDQQDRDFMAEKEMMDAFKKRNQGKDLSSEQLLAVMENIRKPSDF